MEVTELIIRLVSSNYMTQRGVRKLGVRDGKKGCVFQEEHSIHTASTSTMVCAKQLILLFIFMASL